MKAAVLDPAGEVVVEEVEELAPGPNDVVLRVAASGVCHTDVNVCARGGGPVGLLIGHEGAGVVEAVGVGVTGLAAGDVVVAVTVMPCGQCYWCANGQRTLCERTFMPHPARARRTDGAEITAFAGLGTFAEQMTVDRRAVVPVRTDLPMEQLALLGCGITTGFGAAVNAAAVRPGDAVVVIGCGGVGLAAVQGARVAGAATIVAVDRLAEKREAALRFGATEGVDPDDDPVAAVQALTGGRGADVVIDVVGHASTIESGWAMARRGGRIVVVGSPLEAGTVNLSAADVMLSEKLLRGCVFGSSDVARDVPRLVALAERGVLDLAGMITDRIALDDLRQGLAAVGAPDTVRTVVTSF
jgi:S-(hydroxymethyl)glutathione dehydrogenase/alcohol dehydrogenase